MILALKVTLGLVGLVLFLYCLIMWQFLYVDEETEEVNFGIPEWLDSDRMTWLIFILNYIPWFNAATPAVESDNPNTSILKIIFCPYTLIAKQDKEMDDMIDQALAGDEDQKKRIDSLYGR